MKYPNWITSLLSPTIISDIVKVYKRDLLLIKHLIQVHKPIKVESNRCIFLVYNKEIKLFQFRLIELSLCS